MIRLMWSNDRQEVERLKRKLFRAGIRSVIRGNPITSVLGFARLEVFVDEIDLPRATEVHHGLETAVSVGDAAGSPGGGRDINRMVKGEASELVIEAEVLPSPSTEPPR